MSESNQNSGKKLATVAAIATIVGVCITAIALIPAFGQWLFPRAPKIVPPPTSDFQQPTQLPTEINAPPSPITGTDELPLPPSDISITEPPISPSTSPDTILEVGQAWQQGGLELVMTISDWGGGWADEGGGVYTFILTNLEAYDKSFRLSSENFSAVDNFSQAVPVIPKQNILINEHCPSRTVQLPANQTIYLSYELECPAPDYGTLAQAYALTPRIDAGDTSITEIIVSVSVSSISNASWRIPIKH